jgi:hypothetical protein
MRDVYLLSFSGNVCFLSIKGPYTGVEAREIIGLDDGSSAPWVVVDVLTPLEASRMLATGNYEDHTDVLPGFFSPECEVSLQGA